MTNKVLVTGGAGYIGSHACVALASAGVPFLIADNLSNSHRRVLDRIEKLNGTAPVFEQVDIRDETALDALFREHQPTAVMHFAGFKSVNESIENPLAYFDNNVAGTVALLKAMHNHKVKKFIFSSSATVYGYPEGNPINEDAPTAPINPYGRSKLIVEEMLADLSESHPSWRIATLRYFNPVGAHPSGLIGESPNGPPNNLAPYITQVAAGTRDHLNVFGTDYPTNDGTGIRDYIHVQDLVEAHIAALEYLDTNAGLHTFNIGTGKGISVFELLRAFEIAAQRSIKYQVVARRPGDVAECWASPSLANQHLGWKAKRSVADMCADAWNWQQRNPNGY